MSSTNQTPGEPNPAGIYPATGARVLRVDASMRKDNSFSRNLSDELIERLLATDPSTKIVTRDLTSGMPFVNEAWIEANYTEESSRTA